MPIADALKTHMEVTVNGVIASGGAGTINTANVFHYRRTSVVNPLSKAALDTIFQATVVVPMGAALNNRYLQIHNAVRCLDDATDPIVFFAHAVVGAVAGDGMSAINTAYILMRTNLRGKRYKGNKKFGPLSEGDTTAGTEDILNAAAIARFTALVTAMGTALVDANGNTWNLEIISRRPPAQYINNPTTVVGNDVNAILLNKRIGRLRKRERKSVY